MARSARQDIDCTVQSTALVPTANQIELHPLPQQAELRAYDYVHDILT